VDAVTVVEVAPVGTVADAGMASAAVLLERLTRAPTEGALDRVIVHVVLVLEARLAAEHWMPDNVAGVASESVAVLEAPPRDPVIVAVWSTLKFDALAVNVPLLALAAIANDTGTVTLAVLELNITLVAAGAGPDRDAVQVADAFGARLPGMQAIPVRLSVGVADRVTVPFTPVSGTALPVASTPRALLTEITAVFTPCTSVTVTSATTPLGMTVEFPPVARHV
jgi:hypothetical protein